VTKKGSIFLANEVFVCWCKVQIQVKQYLRDVLMSFNTRKIAAHRLRNVAGHLISMQY